MDYQKFASNLTHLSYTFTGHLRYVAHDVKWLISDLTFLSSIYNVSDGVLDNLFFPW